jgi:hypothetical protein
MPNRRRCTLLVLLLTLVLSPGLSLAAGQNLRSAAAEDSPFERLLTWVERTWDGLTGEAPAAAGNIQEKVGCGIDPNGGLRPCLGGGGGVTSTGGH